MRKLLVVLGALLAVHVALLFVRPRGTVAAAAATGPRVGVVFDVGGRGDKSFNDGAYLGAERAIDSLGARVQFIEPGEGSDREAGLRLLAAEGMDLVAGIGFIFTDDLTELAREYPDVPFAGVDYALQTDAAGPNTGSTSSRSDSKTAASRQKREIVMRQKPSSRSHSSALPSMYVR